MNKKTLVIGISMHAAGTERAFLSYVQSLQNQDVTLLLARREGKLLSEIPSSVKVTEMDKAAARLFSLRQSNAFATLLSLFFPRHIPAGIGALRFLPGLLSRKRRKQTAERLWVYAMQKTVPSVTETFDSAVAFWGDHTMFYMVDKIKAKEKIAWLHFEYDCPLREDALYGRYFAKCDRVVTVSSRTHAMLCGLFPDLSQRFVYIPNRVDADAIRERAKKDGNPLIWKPGFRLLSVGRINPVKGYEKTAEALSKLKEEGFSFSWTIVGGVDDVSYYNALQKQIEKSGLSPFVCFAGETDNPYIYMKECDLFLQCSLSESYALAPREALALQKPVLCTDFPAAKSMAQENDTVTICEGTAEAIGNCIRAFFLKNS